MLTFFRQDAVGQPYALFTAMSEKPAFPLDIVATLEVDRVTLTINNTEEAELYASICEANAEQCRDAIREYRRQNAPELVKKLNGIVNKDKSVYSGGVVWDRHYVVYKEVYCGPTVANPNSTHRFLHDDDGIIYYGRSIASHNKVEWIWEVSAKSKVKEVYKIPAQ